jgi:hypothetical protein
MQRRRRRSGAKPEWRDQPDIVTGADGTFTFSPAGWHVPLQDGEPRATAPPSSTHTEQSKATA